jgi:hypothetical protein
MSETQDLEREIQRLSEIIGASESALKAKAMSASDHAWVTKQLGLRRMRLSRLRARLEGLRAGLKVSRNCVAQTTPSR